MREMVGFEPGLGGWGQSAGLFRVAVEVFGDTVQFARLSGRVGMPCAVGPRGLRLAAAALALLGVSCASGPSSSPDDPLEPMNRVVFDFNHKLDTYAALPAARFYRDSLPGGLQVGVHNFISNLNSPVTIANDLLQGDFDRAGSTVVRFGINLTAGIGGVLDAATDQGFPGHSNNFGQTLGYYGVPGWPYLVLPLLGSETPRDLAGHFVDSFFEPTRYVAYPHKAWVSLGLSGLNVLDQRSQAIDVLRDIERSSVDYYATTRSLYLQRRASAIRYGAPDAGNLPSFEN